MRVASINRFLGRDFYAWPLKSCVIQSDALDATKVPEEVLAVREFTSAEAPLALLLENHESWSFCVCVRGSTLCVRVDGDDSYFGGRLFFGGDEGSIAFGIPSHVHVDLC